MAVIANHLTTGGSDRLQTSYATASIAPASNKLIVLAVHNKVLSGTPNIPTVSGAGMTWTQIATKLASNDGTMRITLFRALALAPGSGALTIDCGGQTQFNCHWSIAEFGGVVITGTNGANAVVQNASNDSNSVTSLTVTLAAFANNGNALFAAFFGWNCLDLSPGSGLTQLGEAVNGAGAMLSEWKQSPDTGVDCSRSGTDFMDGMAIEINADPSAALFFGQL